jgi:hypothetical protein
MRAFRDGGKPERWLGSPPDGGRAPTALPYRIAPLPYRNWLPRPPLGSKIQLKREFIASKSKQMKGKESKFPFIYFCESRLFNGLHSKKIK